MKNKLSMQAVIPMCLFVFGLFSCSNNNVNNSARELISGKETTINWKDESEDISSVAATVSVYSMNNRKDTSLKLDSKYRLSTKLINGEQFTRLDMLDASPDGQFRSVVSNADEMILFNSSTEEVQQRIPVDTSANDFAFLQEGIGFGKVNLDLVKTEAKRLSFDLTEDSEKSSLVISLPNENFSTAFEKRISTKVCYDTTSETLTNMETIDVKEDGSTVTTVMEFVYQECDGNYVKIGMITTIDTVYEKRIEGIPEDVPYYDSMDDIPEISEEDFKKMQAEGNVSENSGIKFGDPGDLSSIITIVEVYDEVEVNSTADSAFKLLF